MSVDFGVDMEKMTLNIPEVRTSAVSEESFPELLELLKFRHFKQYYSELDYDWDRMDFLLLKLQKTHPLVKGDLGRFVDFLNAI